MNEWANRLRDARRAKGWTQDRLAEEASVSVSTVRLYEDGYKGSAKSRAKLARAMGYSPDELFPPKLPAPERVAA